MSMQTFETNVVEIAGEKVVRSRFGTFTGEKETAIPEKFERTVQVEGLTVWRSNGEVPFSDMLLDFVSLGKITFEQAEFSALQRKKDFLSTERERQTLPLQKERLPLYRERQTLSLSLYRDRGSFSRG